MFTSKSDFTTRTEAVSNIMKTEVEKLSIRRNPSALGASAKFLLKKFF